VVSGGRTRIGGGDYIQWELDWAARQIDAVGAVDALAQNIASSCGVGYQAKSATTIPDPKGGRRAAAMVWPDMETMRRERRTRRLASFAEGRR